MQNVLFGERFKIEAIRGVVVGRHRLWVAIHHHRFETCISKGKTGMYTAIIKLNSLTNSVWSGSQNQYFLAIRGTYFGFVFVGRIVIGRLCGKFRATSINSLVGRHDTVGLAKSRYGGAIGTPQIRQLSIRKAQSLDAQPLAAAYGFRSSRLNLATHVSNQGHLIKEPLVNMAGFMHPLDIDAPP